MPYDPRKHHRRSIRLPHYDYASNGFYFVTICAYQKQCLFGEVENGTMILNDCGQIVADEWQRSSQIRHEMELDLWVVMPNHFHGIVIIDRRDRETVITQKRDRYSIPFQKPRSLSSLVSGFKSSVSRRINQYRRTPEHPVWQRNYHEHIIRNQRSLQQIREYVQNNPQLWDKDCLNPKNPSKW